MFKILVAEDDAELRQLFCRVLTRHGFQPIGAADGVEALQVLERDYIDLIVSDIMMPQLDGYALVRGLRDSGNTIPVLMITARDGFQDMQFGFLAGADDYLVKPFEMKELMARINAVLRRSEIPDDTRKRLVFDKLEINLDSYELLVDGKKVDTPPKELELLYHLASTPNRVYTRNQLLDEVWGFDYFGDSRTVDVHIKRLREKIENVSDQWELKTVWGVGYKFEVK